MVYDLILDDLKNIIYIFNQPILYAFQKYLEYKLKFFLFGSYDTDITQTALIIIPLHIFIGSYAFYGLHQLAIYLRINKYILFGSFFIIFSPSYYFLVTFNAYDFLTMSMVTIVTYRMIKFLKFQNLTNLIIFLLSLIVLSNYRNFFHPIIFCIPVLIGCYFFLDKKIKRYLILSFLCILISSLNVIKNYILFDTFIVGIGPYAKAKIYASYEFRDKKLLLKLIDKKKMSPIHICFAQQTLVEFTFKKEIFNIKKCRYEVFEKYLKDELNLFKKNNPRLAQVKFLNTHSKSILSTYGNQINYFNIPSGFIPNTLLGLVASKKIIQDVKIYQEYNKKNFFSGMKNSTKQFFRSGNAYMFNIAGNPFNYPHYFSSNLWNFDFLPKLSERKDLKVDTASRKYIAIIILLGSLYMLFYILKTKQIPSNLLLLFLFLLIFFASVDFIPDLIFITFVIMSFLSIITFFKKVTEYFSLKIKKKIIILKNRDIIFFIFSIYFYYIFALVLTAAGEVERYRLVIDPLIAIFFLFYFKRIMIIFKKFFSDKKKNIKKNKIFYIL
jgi:hypothetical protein